MFWRCLFFFPPPWFEDDEQQHFDVPGDAPIFENPPFTLFLS